MKTDLTVTSPDTVAGYTHRFVPRSGPDPRTLLLLHGTGGDENDLLSLGKSLDPQAALLSPRGTVLENGANRFFRRVAEGVFDLEDLRARTDDLARFVREATTQYELDPTNVIAVGFSNGANIAASVLLAHPGTFAGAILFRAMVPFEPKSSVPLSGTRVYVGAGRIDALVPAAQSERLAELLRNNGADVTLAWQSAGHTLTRADLDSARSWLQS
jgi:phospholipase/carboxylesterase/glyoxalase family protein